MAEALAVVTLDPLATLGTSVCGTNIHRCTTARWGAGRSRVIVGTEVLGRSCHINQEELLSPSNGSHSLCQAYSRGPVKSLHVDLLQDLAGNCPLQKVLGVLVRTLAL